MKLVKQSVTLPIINIDDLCVDERKILKRRHGQLFPNSIRSIICGPSNCGKSNALMSMLLNENGLRFENIYIYSKSLYQPKYTFLEKVLSGIVGYYSYKENEEILDPSAANSNSVFIFDDVACHEQGKIREFFSMGRHNAIDSFYLCQSYTRIPKHLIRDNANFLILYKQDDMNLKHIYTDHVSSDMTFEEFKRMCHSCWKEKYGFLTIDKDSDEGRYRYGLDTYIKH